MKHTDAYIKEIFSKKLGEYESAVSPEVWGNIASQLPQAATTASSAAVVAKTISAKLIWTAAVVAVSVASVVTYLAVKNEDGDNKAITQTTEQNAQPNTQATTEETVKEETPATEEVKNIAPEKNVSESKTVVSQNKSSNKRDNSTQAANGNNSASQPVPIRVVPEVPQEPVVLTPTTSNVSNTSSASSQDAKQNEDNSKQALTAQFSIAPVNKEELRYFFMPQFAEAQSYLWDFGNEATATEISPMHTFDEEGIVNVHLTITGKDGEKKTFSQKLSVFEPGKIDVPNIFTPNGDGQNDYFDVWEKSKNVDIQMIVVFSSDKKVFESEGDKLWDGNDPQGNPLPAGEYNYFVSGMDKEGNKIDKKGFVTLRRL